MPDVQGAPAPFAEEAGAHLVAMLRAAARARLGRDVPTALAEIAEQARGLRGAAATMGMESVADAALAIERDALGSSGPDEVATLADAVGRLNEGLALMLRGHELLACGRDLRATVIAADHPVAVPHAASGPSVLVVDDSPLTGGVHAELLRRAGFEVRRARDGSDALSVLRAAAVDLVVSDVDMAPMDGFGLLRAVREDPATAELPFIFVSARSADAVRAACGNAHVDDVLPKGSAETRLVATARGALTDDRRQPGARVLVADDSALVRSMMRDHLVAAGYDVLEAGDGAEALARARAELPDVVLLDRDMPVLDGFGVLEGLRGDEATSAIPVVFVTGRATAVELADGLERGAHDYVRKPVEAAELIARVRSALRMRRLRDELRERNLQLERMARTDVLTGLVARRHGAAILAEACRDAAATSEPLALVMADVDHFKSVNDRYGHAAGDGVLRGVARVLSDLVVSGETAVRWGGEEFLVILPGSDGETAVRRAERLCAALAAEQIDAGDVTLPVTASLGCAALAHGETPEALVARADEALYAAKEGGRNRVVAARAAVSSPAPAAA